MMCKPGYYSLTGVSNCLICPENKFCADPTRYPSKCPDGQTAPEGSIACEGAPQGVIIDITADPPTSTNCTATG
jgi:hypothetical protein